MKNFLRSILLISAFAGTELHAQMPDTVLLSPVVGKVIDSAEKINNRIMAYYSYRTFKHAVIFRNADSSLFIRATFKNASLSEKPLSTKEFNWMRSVVEADKSPLEIRNYSYTKSLDSARFVKIRTTDGAELYGRVVKENNQELTLNTKSLGEVTIQKNKIAEMQQVDPRSLKDGKIWFENPNSTRYFVGPSAMMLKPGEGYYQNNYVLLNSVNVGITNFFSMGAGFEFLSTFGVDAGGPIAWVSPKVGTKVSKNVHVAGGALYISVPEYSFNGGTNKRYGTGTTFTVITLGNKDHNFTLGGGLSFSRDEWRSKPTLTLSGMTRIARKTALVTENWFVPTKAYTGSMVTSASQASYSYEGYYSYGVRFFGESMSVDLGFINHREIAEFLFIGIPYVDFVVKFGGKNKK